MFENNRILVSIIIPVFNTPYRYLQECLSPFINGQRDQRIEIIVIDDGSSSETQEILKHFSEMTTKNKITFLRQENAGQNAARNSGIRFAKGKYIAFLDSDDSFDMVQFGKVVDRLESDDIDVLCFNCKMIGRGHNEHRFGYGEEFVANADKTVLIRQCAQLWLQCFRRRLFDEKVPLPEVGTIGEDLVSVIPLIARAEKCEVVGLYPYRYNIRPGSVMHASSAQTRLEILDAFEHLIDKNPSVLLEYRDEIEWQVIYHILFYETRNVLNSEGGESPVLSTFRRWANMRFPDWKANPYLQSMPEAQEFRFKLVVHGHYKLFLAIRDIKRVIDRREINE